jgi:hypothetical protein
MFMLHVYKTIARLRIFFSTRAAIQLYQMRIIDTTYTLVFFIVITRLSSHRQDLPTEANLF